MVKSGVLIGGVLRGQRVPSIGWRKYKPIEKKKEKGGGGRAGKRKIEKKMITLSKAAVHPQYGSMLHHVHY